MILLLSPVTLYYESTGNSIKGKLLSIHALTPFIPFPVFQAAKQLQLQR